MWYLWSLGLYNKKRKWNCFGCFVVLSHVFMSRPLQHPFSYTAFNHLLYTCHTFVNTSSWQQVPKRACQLGVLEAHSWLIRDVFDTGGRACLPQMSHLLYAKLDPRQAQKNSHHVKACENSPADLPG